MHSIIIYLITPRSFCAGVTRAIEIVEKTITKYNINENKPIYIKHEIVHNKTVVDSFKQRGVKFVQHIDEIPNEAVTIFSAHGVSNEVEDYCINHNMLYIDATCPLVKKIHNEGLKYHEKGYYIILIGHRGHPEVEGTFGRIPNNITIVSDENEAENIKIPDNLPLCYITQTTLSMDDTKNIVDILKRRFPCLESLSKSNICYATQNRQNAIKAIINILDALIIVGSRNSSNSNRLKELGSQNNKASYLIDNVDEIPIAKLKDYHTIGISAGASAPDKLVFDMVEKIKEFYNVEVRNYDHVEENVTFFVPKILRNVE